MKIRSRGCSRLIRKANTKQLETRDNTTGGLSVAQLQMIEYGFPTASGVTITESTVLSISAAYACINLIASTIGSLHNHVYQKLPNGGKKPAPKHPAERTINFWDHELTNRVRGWQAILVNCLTTGNGFAQITRLPNGAPESLLIQLSRNVELRDDRNGDLYYWLRKESQRIEPENMLHIACMGFSGVEGINPIRSHAIALGNATAQQEYLNHLYANDSTPGGIITTPPGVNKQLTDDSVKRAKDTWQELHGGVQNVRRVSVLPNGYSYQSTQLTPVDAAIIEQMKWSVSDIGRIFGVPLSMLNGEITGESYSDQKQQWIDLSLRSWLTNIEAECHKKLFKPEEREKYFCEYRIEGLLRGDAVARATYYQTLWNIAAINSNEIRSAEGLNPYQGGEHYMLPINNVAPVDSGIFAGSEVTDNPGDTAPNEGSELLNSIEPVLYTEVGRLVRRGFRSLTKDPSKLEEFRTHTKECLEPFVGLITKVNPLTLDQLVEAVLTGTTAVKREVEVGDMVRTITRKILVSTR